MSRVSLERADTEPLAFDERLTIPVAELGEDVVSVAGLRLAGEISRGERGYLIEGRLESQGMLRCVRCLEPFAFEVGEPFAVRLQAAAMAPRDPELRLDREELDVVFYEEPVADLSAIAAEQFLLAVPMKPLCNEGCRGLCSRCGTNLNREQCSCLPEDDQRWQPLAGWQPSN